MPVLGDGNQPAVVRTTQSGRIEGIDDTAQSGTLHWLGVPFAKPPVGALRWRAPLDPVPWTGTLAAKAFAHACVQFGTLGGPGANNTYDSTIASTLNQAVGSEDCLYLNIWRPATGETKLPVVVFIHGGFNLAGYTADPLYNGANLAMAANVVVVTVNFRIGVFGWFRLPQLKTGDAVEDSGNFGTLDNIKALQWVQRNIEGFGGNAGNVTLMGQSSGAINTWALMVARQIRNTGLFHKVAALSGGISLASNLPKGMIPLLNPAPYYAAQGKTLLHALLIADRKATDDASAAAFLATQTSVQVADYLRSQSPSSVLATLFTKLAPMGLGASGPIPDGTVLPADPIAAIAGGDYAKVPVLAGNTRDEGKLFSQFLALSPALGGVPGPKVNDADRFLMLYNFDPNAATELTTGSLINPQYLPVDAPDTGYNAKTALLTKLLFIANRDNVLNTLKTQQPNVWHYQFNWAQEPPPWNDVYGAAHAFDLPFLFGNFGPSAFSRVVRSNTNKAGCMALSKAMIASLAAFARSGDPNNASLATTWPPWPKTLVFDANLAEMLLSVP